MTNLVGAFAASVEQQPGKIALFWGDREFSYTELWKQAVFVSEQLRQRFGVKSGARIGLWLKNCPEFIPSLFGILHAGAIAVPINNFLKPAEVRYILEDAGVDILITDEDLGAHFQELQAARPRLQIFKAEAFAS